MAETMDQEFKDLLKPEAYKGSAQKTLEYYLGKSDNITRSKFKSALLTASVRKHGGLSNKPVQLSKQEAMRVAKNL